LLIVQALHSNSKHTLVMRARTITSAAFGFCRYFKNARGNCSVKTLCNPQGWMQHTAAY